MTNPRNYLDCVHCQNKITLGTGLSPGASLQSIRMQAKEIGVEIYCDQCDSLFIFDNPEILNEPPLPMPANSFINPNEHKTVQSQQEGWKWC